MAAQSVAQQNNPHHHSADATTGSTAGTNREPKDETLPKTRATKRISYSDAHYDYIVLDEDDDDGGDEEEIIEEEIIEEEIIEEEIMDEDDGSIVKEMVQEKKFLMKTEGERNKQYGISDPRDDISSHSSEACPFDEMEDRKESIIMKDVDMEEEDYPDEESINESPNLYWAMQGALETYLTADLDVLYSFPPWSPQSTYTTMPNTDSIHDSWKSWDTAAKLGHDGTKSQKDNMDPPASLPQKERRMANVVKVDPSLLSENDEEINLYSQKEEELSPIPEHSVNTTEDGLSGTVSKKRRPAEHATTDKKDTTNQRGKSSSVLRKSSQRPRGESQAPGTSGQPKQRQLAGDIESQQQQQPNQHHRFRNSMLNEFFDEPVDLVNPAAARLAQAGDPERQQHPGQDQDLDAETDADRRVAGAVVLGILLLLPLLAMGIVLVVRNEQNNSSGPNGGNGGNNMVEVIPMMPTNTTTSNIFVEQNSTNSFRTLPP